MPASFWTVVEHLEKQHPGRWFIVGSFAAWHYLSRKDRRPHWSKEEWQKVVPGDVDIAISYEGVTEATVNVEGAPCTKFNVDFVVPKTEKLCGTACFIKEVELVYNDAANKYHENVTKDEITHLPFVSVSDLYPRISQGSAMSGAKDEARMLRASGLLSQYGDLIKVTSKVPKVRTTTVPGASIFAQIAALKKDY